MPNLTKTQKSQSGFTLIEVLVTILIIGVTLVIYGGASKASSLNKENKYKEIALRIADQKIQDLRTDGYSSIPASGSFADSMLSSLPSGSGNITVSNLNAETKDVVVRVTWISPQTNTTREVELETYISSGGLGQ